MMSVLLIKLLASSLGYVFAERCLLSPASPWVGETAGEDTENLAGVGHAQHIDAGDLFDPFKAATAWDD
jgi:hypothetical protein